MATLPQAQQMPVDEYIARYVMGGEKPACEYLDGVLIPKSMGTSPHATVQMNVGFSIRLRYGKQFKVLPELSVEIRGRSHYRIPDIAVVDRARPIGDYPGPDNPCYLCVEVLSPPDTRKKLFAKCRDAYHAWGVPYCWVIDPVKRRAWEYFPRDEAPREVSGHISAGIVTLELAEVFDDLD